MRLTLMFRSVLAIAFLLIASVSNAQIKYRSDGGITNIYYVCYCLI